MGGEEQASGPLLATGSVTVVTQTRVRAESAEAFARWQEETGATIASFPGFLRQSVIPPAPPVQVDWVILQQFSSTDCATAWLNSTERLKRIAQASPMLVGRDDVHIVSDQRAGLLPSPVSAVISTCVKPGQEAAYRAWEQRIAAAQTKARGFQGYRFEPPVPGVQQDWLAILSFDTEANLQAWLDSSERQKLLRDAEHFTQEFHTRIARTGFEQWFSLPSSVRPPPPAWQQNLLVLLLLYPIVFLFGLLVQTPLLVHRAGLSFATALFIGNVVSVLSLSYLVPWTSEVFSWWLQPAHSNSLRRQLAGTGVLIALYATMIVAFNWLS